jgi:uncharacterized protein (TIRG00374 family)
MSKKVGIAVFGVFVSVVALAWAAKGVDWHQLGAVFKQLPIWVPLVAVTAYLLSFIPRAYRSLWMLTGTCLHPLSVSKIGEAQVMGYAANNLLPLRLGELVRVFALRKLSGVPSLIGLASLLAERILDGAVVVIILAVSVAWFAQNGTNFGQTAVEPLLYTGAALFAATSCGLVILALASRWIGVCSERLLPPRLHLAVGSILGALAFFRNPKRALGVIMLSATVWLVEGSVFVLAASALGVENPWMPGLLMLAIVNLGILLPSAPGYVGVFQVCGILAFQAIGLPREQGLAASLLVHACQFLPITALGLLLASRHGWTLRSMAQSNPKANL